MRNQRIPKRLHVQGAGEALRLRRSSGELTDGAGLLLVRKLWDRMELGSWIDQRAKGIGGHFRPSLMVELWIALALYGGRSMDDLPRLARRGVRRLFGWKSVPVATTYGRWLRRAGEELTKQLDALLWQVVLMHWKVAGVPREVMLVLDSHVVVRYGEKQAGAEKGYNPKKPGRRSHHPLVAFLAETGDCLGVRWRSGSAHTAEGAREWIEEQVKRLRAAGVERITVRLDKGFFSKAMVETLQRLEVEYVLKVPAYKWARTLLGPLRQSKKDQRLWTGSAPLYGARLLAVEQRRELKTEDG
ncbi:MAG TPA: transposase, partial [Longimicrobium sp.]